MTLEQNIQAIADAVEDMIFVESARDAGSVIAELAETFSDMRKVLIEKEKLERSIEQIDQRQAEINARLGAIRNITKPGPRRNVEEAPDVEPARS